MTLISTLRRILPTPIRSSLRSVKVVGRRVDTLVRVMAMVRGVSASDRNTVSRSMIANVFALADPIDQWSPPKLVEDARIKVAGFGTFMVRGQSDDLAHVLPFHQHDVSAVVKKLIKPGDILVDAGANLGVVTVIMAQATGPSGRVVSFEMMPDTASILRENVILNCLTNVTVIEAALSDRVGDTVTASVTEGMFGQASIAVEQKLIGTTRRVDVQTTTLDVSTQDLPAIALLKIDLEGAEVKALHGATATLAKTRAIIMESWDGVKGEAVDILRHAGYEITLVDSRNILAIKQ